MLVTIDLAIYFSVIHVLNEEGAYLVWKFSSEHVEHNGIHGHRP